MDGQERSDRMSERVRQLKDVNESTEAEHIANSLRLDQTRSDLVERAKDEDTELVQIEESESYKFATKFSQELRERM